MITIYHNPRCSKSRTTLALLRENSIAPRIVHYLETPPPADTLKAIVGMLGCSVHDIIRTNEEVYRRLNLHKRLPPEAELFAIVAANPQLLQRPIVVNHPHAVLGRPPQNVLAIL